MTKTIECSFLINIKFTLLSGVEILKLSGGFPTEIINLENHTNAVEIYPDLLTSNENQITLTSTTTMNNASFQILNVMGDECYFLEGLTLTRNNPQSITIPKLEPGLYFLLCNDELSRAVSRFSVN